MNKPTPQTSVGFTGTRKGMTKFQMESLRFRLSRLRPKFEWFHHGNCRTGADKEAAGIACELGFKIAVHPAAEDAGQPVTGDYVYTPVSYLERNRGIVNESALMLAAPG